MGAYPIRLPLMTVLLCLHWLTTMTARAFCLSLLELLTFKMTYYALLQCSWTNMKRKIYLLYIYIISFKRVLHTVFTVKSSLAIVKRLCDTWCSHTLFSSLMNLTQPEAIQFKNIHGINYNVRVMGQKDRLTVQQFFKTCSTLGFFCNISHVKSSSKCFTNILLYHSYP